MGESRRASNIGDLMEVVVRPKKYYRTSTSGNDTRDKIVVDQGESYRIIKNVIVISVAMMTQFVAYQGTLNLQSSLNAEGGLGTISLSCIYLSMGISCLILPTLMIRHLTCKWTLVVGMLCFVPYIAFQLYSHFFTLLPAGIILGIGAAPMWAAQATYLTQIGQVYAIIKGAEVDAIITLFFGIFFFAWQNADSIGNLLSSLGDYRTQEKYEKLAKELAAERARIEEIDFAKHRAESATRRIQKRAEEQSDGEADDLDDDVKVSAKRKKTNSSEDPKSKSKLRRMFGRKN